MTYQADQQPILFDIYPDLADKIPWIPLGSFPTSIQRLQHLSQGELMIKRDDLSSDIYGGNKVRKLEFILADVLQKGKKHVITMGGIGTNHGLATAIFCRRLNLDCTLLLFYQPITSYVIQNMLLFHKFQAEMVYTGTILRTGIEFYLPQRIKHPQAYFLYAGGSSIIGTLGFVNAAFELKKQIAEQGLAEPKYIFCPLGSNGTAAGIALGCALAGITSTICAIRVAASHLGPFQITTPATLRGLMEKTYKLLQSKSSMIPSVDLRTPIVIYRYFGKAYGEPTAAGLDALKQAREQEGISLDPTYTSKAFAGVLDFIKANTHRTEEVLYWHTYNSSDLSHEAQLVDYHDLPPVFHQFFIQQDTPV